MILKGEKHKPGWVVFRERIYSVAKPATSKWHLPLVLFHSKKYNRVLH